MSLPHDKCFLGGEKKTFAKGGGCRKDVSMKKTKNTLPLEFGAVGSNQGESVRIESDVMQ